MYKYLYIKRLGIHFHIKKKYENHGALTLRFSEIIDEHNMTPDNYHKVYSDRYIPGNYYRRIHDDGWTIGGILSEDWYLWVNHFDAEHPKYGRVWGNFEDIVFADSEKAYQHFYKNHRPEAWDYHDI
jgi:hypothetical protein